jgi:predicted secreted protein
MERKTMSALFVEAVMAVAAAVMGAAAAAAAACSAAIVAALSATVGGWREGVAGMLVSAVDFGQ